MSVVAEVTARITADVRGFTTAMQSAVRATESLKRETAGMADDSIDVNARPFIDAVDSANRRLDALQADARTPVTVHGNVTGINNGLAGTTAVAGKAKGAMGGVLGSFGKVAMVGGVAAMGVGMLAHGLGSMATKAQESASIAKTTEQIIKNTGGAANVSAAQVSALATSISNKSGMDDEAIQSGLNLLLTFQKVSNAGKGQAAIFDRASAAAVDLAATGFTSVEGASKMLGKALNDPAKGLTALGKAGIKFTDAEKKKIAELQKSGKLLEAQQVILGKVEGKVKGVAAAAASPMEKMKVQFENLQETIGAALLPVITRLSAVLGPIFERIGPPLADVVGLLGGAFADVLQAIGPALGPLSQAFAAIAGIVGGALSSVITAITPTLTIVAGILAELANSIGPILAPVLSTIAVLFQAVLGIVTPLLAPLAELIQTILAAAAPILDVVAGALIQVVDALMPIIYALQPILPLFGQLVTMLGTILTPILMALTPIITAVASVLANVLGRAIGLTQAGIGGLIWGFSKVAPFVLNNVTIPVVNAFVQMASDIVGAAATALSWVPGLGDKLGEAKIALDGFQTKATTALKGAADTIATQGEAIATTMMDTGRGMLVNGPPEAEAAGAAMGTSFAAGMAAQNGTVAKAAAEQGKTAEKQMANTQAAAKAKTEGTKIGANLSLGIKSQTQPVATAATSVATSAKTGLENAQLPTTGRTIGTGLGDGVISGIRSTIDRVAEAAYNLGKTAAERARAGAQVSSPSKVTVWVGRMIAQGLAVGIAKERGRVVQEAKFAAADALDAVKAAQKAVREAKGSAERAKALRDLTRAQWAYADAAAAARSAGAEFDQQFLTAGIEAATAKLDALKDKARTVIDSMLDFGKVTSLAVSNGVQPMAGAIVANMQQRLAAVKAFGANLKKLRGLGLNDAALQDIISQGPVAGNQYAEALLADTSSIGQLNQLRKEMVAASGGIGDTAAFSSMNADNPYAGSGVVNSNVAISDGAVVINFNGKVSAADRAAIKGDITESVQQALRELALEIQRGGR